MPAGEIPYLLIEWSTLQRAANEGQNEADFKKPGDFLKILQSGAEKDVSEISAEERCCEAGSS